MSRFTRLLAVAQGATVETLERCERILYPFIVRGLRTGQLLESQKEALLKALSSSSGVGVRAVTKAYKAIKVEDPDRQTQPGRVGKYFIEGGAICLEKDTKDGPVPAPLCNFTAKIIGERVKDDGVERSTVFVLEGALASGHKLPTIEVKASRFAPMSWPTDEWGARAIVNAGMGAKDHTRAAIQALSGDIPRQTTYTHLGWREIDGAHYYLHAGGAIGAPGETVPDDLHVELEAKLEHFTLPEPPTGTALADALKASLRFLDLAPDHLTVPLLSLPYRAVLGGATFSAHLSGRTGAGKSVLCVLTQQHYGAALDETRIPGSWSSTANALEGLAFTAKDALVLVDDFKPEGTQNDVQRMHAAAARLFRAQGNLTGRGRMKADGSLRPDKPPRGLILSTGEDIPTGHSIRARNILLDISPSDTRWAQVTTAQKEASSGLYAAALSGFIAWLAQDYTGHKERFDELHKTYRGDLQGAAHKRTSDAGAQMLATYRLVLDFGHESGVWDEGEQTSLWRRLETAILSTVEAQSVAQEGGDPVTQFCELLTDVLSSERGHVATPDGAYPGPGYGWTVNRYRNPLGELQETPIPNGKLLGWLDGERLYLIPGAIYAELQNLARQQNTAVTVTQQTLWGRLYEAGVLVDREAPRNTVRVSFDGRARQRLICVAISRVYISGPSGPSGPTELEMPSQTQNNVDRLAVQGKTQAVQAVPKAVHAVTDASCGPLSGKSGPLAKTQAVPKIGLEMPSQTQAGPLGPLGPLNYTVEIPANTKVFPELTEKLHDLYKAGELKDVTLKIPGGKTSDLEKTVGALFSKRKLTDAEHYDLGDTARRYFAQYGEPF